MKKIVICLLTTFLTFTFIPNEAKAETLPIKKEAPAASVLSKDVLDKVNELKVSEKPILKNINRKNAKEEIRKALAARGFFLQLTMTILLLVIVALLIIMIF